MAKITPASDRPEPAPSKALQSQPSRLFVEVTSRCNLRCRMCVKQSAGASGAEGDMSRETFAALEPVFAGLDALILNGVGEPLLHPDLPWFVKRAKALMPASSWVGFQTNGHLLDEAKARELARAGLDRICLSVDAVSPSLFNECRSGGELGHVEAALSALAAAKAENPGSRLAVGIEFVLMRDNAAELAATLAWAAKRGVCFAIVSHVLAYAPAMREQSLFGLNLDASRALYADFKRRAGAEGVDVSRYFEVLWKYEKTPQEQRLVDCVKAMSAEAADLGVPFHVGNLIAEDAAQADGLEVVYRQARETAAASGIELSLPRLHPSRDRRCSSVADGGAFVAFDGRVAPCYFLWRGYTCYYNGRQKTVAPRFFGNVADGGLPGVWNSPEYVSFRERVSAGDYPFCTNCNVYPCSDIESTDMEFDCYGESVPCGDCLWCLGLLQCLGQEHGAGQAR